MIKLSIDGKEIEVSEGTTVLRAAEMAGSYIPTLCDHPNLTPSGGCRLCIVEIEGMRLPMASCTLPVSQGMIVRTDTEKLRASRQFILTMLFSERNHFCPFCLVSGGDCELQNAAYHEEMTHWPFQPNWNKFSVDSSHPYLVLDNNRCILCRRCVRACNELVGNATLGMEERGAKTMLIADGGIPFGESSCISCGTCVQICPTGALMDRYSAYQGHSEQMQHIRSTCVGCSIGCGIEALTRDNRLVSIRGDWNATPNHGVLCQNGRYAPQEDNRQRVTQPLVRKNGQLEPSTWDEALETIVNRMKPLVGQSHSGVAALISTRLPAETLAIFKQIFADHFHSDMVTSIEEGRPSAFTAQLADELGSPFETGLEMLNSADCILAIGVNLINNHQVAGFMVKRRLLRGARLVVIDPQENELDDLAHVTLKPAPDSDAQTLQALSAALVEIEFNSVPSQQQAGQMHKIAHILHNSQQVAIIYGKGITAKNNADALTALNDLTQQIRSLNRSATLLSIKGEANSLAATQYHLDRPFQLNGHQAAYVVLGDDYPSQRLLQTLSKAPFKIVQASYVSSLTEVSDIVLPVTIWAEQEGHYVNLEGRLSKTNKILQAPDSVWSNQSVLENIAQRMQFALQENWKEMLYERIPSIAILDEA